MTKLKSPRTWILLALTGITIMALSIVQMTSAEAAVKGGAIGLLKKPKKQRQSCRTVFTMCLFGGVQRPSICSAPLIIHIGS